MLDNCVRFAAQNPHRMVKEKVLVIGASGQIGVELTLALRRIYGNANVVASDLREENELLKGSGPYVSLDVMNKEMLHVQVIRQNITQIYLLAAILSATGEKNPNLAWHLTLTLDPGLLVRVRPTESQAGLTPRQRRLNMRRAFAVADPARVAGRNILLIDDILTTGATARAASRALVDAGAASVWVVTLARAQRNSIESFGAFAWTHNTLPDAVPGFNSQVMHESHHQPSF